MKLSELINEILSEWSYRVDNGMPDPVNESHIFILSEILSEMGLGSVKHEIIQNLTEIGDKTFSNPILNRVVKYKSDDGKDKEGLVGNLLRLQKSENDEALKYINCTSDDSLIYLHFDRGAIIGAKCKYDVNGGLKGH